MSSQSGRLKELEYLPPEVILRDRQVRILPVGHFMILLEDLMVGLDKTFVEHMELKDVVEYAFAESTYGVLENPKSYILRTWTAHYLLLNGFGLDTFTEDPDLYDYVFLRLKEAVDGLTNPMANYLNIAMGTHTHQESRDFTLLRWFQDTNIMVAKIREHDPFAF